MQFRYRAVRADGQIQRGVLLAAHPADLSQRLARTGLTLLAWQAQSGWRAYGWAARVSRRDVIHFCFYLEQLTRAGVPLLDGLRDLRDSVDNPRLRDVVANLVEDVQGGQQLSQALAAHPAVFSPLMVGLVAAGELAGTLSGGERQMLAMGRALMAKPKLLMLDEPSLGLAPLVIKEIFRTISALKETGVAILLVEQNARAALQVSNYGYVLETGEVKLAGQSAELAADPRVIEAYLGLGHKH